jgi:predicted heme/steroid binding protein/uncharacterized membrane protein
MNVINTDDLKAYNGKEGKPAYIVYEGDVYDVTESRLWKGGTHMLRHHAGADLTSEIQAAPHTPEVLQRYQKVALLSKGAAAQETMPLLGSRLMKRFPFLRRHPHPMTVHFPIVFMFSATIFTLLYLCTGIESFESTGLHCLAAGLLFTPIVMATGYYTWWLNYSARPMKPVIIKQRCSILLLATETITFIWRLSVPDILSPIRPASAAYLVLVCSLFPLVAVVGWFGSTLTFPLEKE